MAGSATLTAFAVTSFGSQIELAMFSIFFDRKLVPRVDIKSFIFVN